MAKTFNGKKVGDLEITRWHGIFRIYKITRVTETACSAEYTGECANTYDEACELVNRMRKEQEAQKSLKSRLFSLAWQFVKRNGFTMSQALKCAWCNVKLEAKMQKSIVKFYFQKIDGSIREAFGTLKSDLLPQTSGNSRKPNDTVFTYFNTEKQEYRCFKKANLIKMA